MPQTLNIPVPTAAYRQPKLVLKNRRARRSRSLVKTELTVVGGTSSPPIELPPLPMTTSGTDQVSAVQTDVLADNHHLSQAVLLDWLGSQPVAFHRIYVDVCGSVTAAVWLSMVLSLLDGEGKKQVDAQGVFRFTLSPKACEIHTGLTDAEQRKARGQLVDCDLLKLDGKKSGTTIFALDMNKLTQRLLSHSAGLAELVKNATSSGASQLDVHTLERRAQARASRRRA